MRTPSHRFFLATQFFAWLLGIASIYLSGGLLSGLALAQAYEEGMERQVLKYEGIFAYVPQSRNVEAGDAARLCEALRINSLRWRLPTNKEVKETIKVKDPFQSIWVEKDTHSYACQSNRSYFRNQGNLKDMGCRTVCVSEDATAVRPTAVLPPVTEKPKVRIDSTAALLTKDPERPASSPQEMAKAGADYDAKVKKERDVKVATENAAREIRSMAYVVEQRKICKQPGMQGMCSCLMYEPVPPGGRKVCGK